MTKEEVQSLLSAAELLAPLAGPYGSIAVGLFDAAMNEAAALMHKGELTPEEVADVQARASVADDAWDAAVAKAKAGDATAGA